MNIINEQDFQISLFSICGEISHLCPDLKQETSQARACIHISLAFGPDPAM